jgi:hypothetical protein
MNHKNLLKNMTPLSMTLLLSMIANPSHTSLIGQTHDDAFKDMGKLESFMAENAFASHNSSHKNDLTAEKIDHGHLHLDIEWQKNEFSHEKFTEVDTDDHEDEDDNRPSSVPVPAAAWLLGSGLLGLLGAAFKRKAA